MRLNFACGGTRWQGFENSDVHGEDGTRYVDLESFPYPYDDESAELIMLSHALQMTHVVGGERVPVHPDFRPIMQEFHRILRPGGWLRIDDNPLRIYRDGEYVDEGERAAEAARGFPDEFRIARDDLIRLLLDVGFLYVDEVSSVHTHIPGDDFLRATIVANHLDHYSFALEARKGSS